MNFYSFLNNYYFSKFYLQKTRICVIIYRTYQIQELIMKFLENLILKSCGFTLSILFIFYLGGTIADFTNPYIDFKTFLTVLLFGTLIAVAGLLFKIEKMHIALRVLIHYLVLFISFTVIFIISGNISAKGAAAIFTSLIIFTFFYAIMFTAAYFLRKLIKNADARIDKNAHPRPASKKRSEYKKLYKNEDWKMSIIKLSVGDTIMMKKKHPCSSDLFSIARLGSDIRIICKGCSRDLTLPRESLEKMIKKVIPLENS